MDPPDGAADLVDPGQMAPIKLLGAAVPEDFPRSIPLYPGAKVALAARSANPEGKQAWSVKFESSDPRDKVAAYYRSSMHSFKAISDMTVGKTDVSAWENAAYDVTVMVTGESNQATAVTLNLVAK